MLAVGAPVPAFAYDASWYKANGWSGEYPHGFTMAADVTIDIRKSFDPNVPKSVSCLLKKGATYHPWNGKRVTSDQLEFVSFTKIEIYELKSGFTANVYRDSDGRNATIKFKKGDRWSYLAYLSEGRFLFKFNNTVYVGDQDLFANSTEIITPINDDQNKYDEWLKLTCANGAVGWIFVNETKDAPVFANPNIDGYGAASDQPQSEPIQRSAQVPSTKNAVAPSAPKVSFPVTPPSLKPQLLERPSLGDVSISIAMRRKGGTYVVPVLINNAITLDFVVDSGAADVSIPADVVLTLIRTGTINSGDFIDKRTYRLADGSTMPSTTFRIRSLKVGGRVVENVTGSVAPATGSLLLGQSFLSRFNSWSVNNSRHELVLH